MALDQMKACEAFKAMNFFVLMLAFFSQSKLALATEVESTHASVMVTEEPIRSEGKKSIDLKVYFEARAHRTQNLNGGAQEKNGFHELSMGVEAPLDRVSRFFAAISIKQNGQTGQSEFELEETGLSWSPITQLSARAGQIQYPFGIYSTKYQEFSSPPFYYSRALPAGEKYSLGLDAKVRPISEDWLFFEGSAFAGSGIVSRSYRDPQLTSELVQANRTLESPWFVGLGSNWRGLSARAQHFQHRMPTYRKLIGSGASLEWDESFLKDRWGVRLGGEYYQLLELQDAGPLEESLVHTLYADLRVFWFRVGQRRSSGNGKFRSPSLLVDLGSTAEEISFAELNYPEFLTLRYEQVALYQEFTLVSDQIFRFILSSSF
jgi:hypothetical protein